MWITYIVLVISAPLPDKYESICSCQCDAFLGVYNDKK